MGHSVYNIHQSEGLNLAFDLHQHLVILTVGLLLAAITVPIGMQIVIATPTTNWSAPTIVLWQVLLPVLVARAVLKTKNVKLTQIKKRKELVIRWVNLVEKVDEEKKISRLFNVTSLPKDKRMQKFRSYLIENMREGPSSLEDFLRHYDLAFSSNSLIFGEWLWHVGRGKAGETVMEALNHE